MMGNIYAGVSVGMGFILFCILLSFIWLTFKNYTKGIFPQKNLIDPEEFIKFQVEEKSNDRRMEIMWPVSIETDSAIIKAETKEINRAGAFIKCNSPFLPGEKFRLKIEAPGKRVIVLNADVLWSNRGIPDESVITRGMGIRFIKNPDEDMTALKIALGEHIEYKKRLTAGQVLSLPGY